MVLICGVEEAGRGPAIGPMVMCGLVVKEEDIPKLVSLGVKDSKLLTPRTRERLFNEIIKIAKRHKIVKLSPKEIDVIVDGPKSSNLNWLEAVTSADLINALKPDKAILDCPSPNLGAYKKYVLKLLDNKDIKLVVSHKADLKYPVVSAASIIAKVTRDKEIEKLKKKVGMDFGSGYPSDPNTRHFLELHLDKCPDIVRHSWMTVKKLKSKKKQSSLGQY
ncbi:ribonuclease HII [Candidatus Woesearchaeota archaeon]|nr:ribonuclease HII [Candidatus Woesearchaeota archaeon]